MDLKRKRMGKTTVRQYEEYISMMEVDAVFRTGTINPNVDSKYLNKKWEELTNKLNSVGGPALTVLEWKKRFNDWKNSTRAKYRKGVEDRKGTGGGPVSQPFLSSLEERGLAVWGKVAVPGSKHVPVAGGLQELLQVTNVTHAPEPAIKELLPDEAIDVGEKPPLFSHSVDIPVTSRFKKKTRARKERSLKNMGHELLSYYKKNVDQVEVRKLEVDKMKLEVENRRLDMEERRLNFEIQKYEFENPDCKFNL